MKIKKTKITTKKIVQKIKKDLLRQRIWKKGLIEIPHKKTKTEIEMLKLQVEFALSTARDYNNPEYIMPRNPFFRFIKKRILSILRVYTNYQTVFNKNVLMILEDLYKYLKILEKRQKNEKSRSSNSSL